MEHHPLTAGPGFGRGFAAATGLLLVTLTSVATAQGGEDAAGAVPLTVPGTVTGTTLGYADDADEACPYEGSTSPGPCIVACTGTIEGEPCNFGNTAANDTFNGGCNCGEPEGCFQAPVVCGEVVCGTSYFDGSIRDTDWYSLDISGYEAGVGLEVSWIAEFASVVCRFDNGIDAEWPIDCEGIVPFCQPALAAECEQGLYTSPVLTGERLVFWIAPDFTQIVDCHDPDPEHPGIGADYALTVGCAIEPPPCPWDFDGNQDVGFADLLGVLSNWGPCP